VTSIEAGHAVHWRGSDARQGDVLIERGCALSPQHVGIAAAAACDSLAVARRPRAIVLTSGDEVVLPGQRPLPHQIRNSNAPMLTALLARMGAQVAAHRHVPDDEETTRRAVGEALQSADLILSVGGISAGEKDFFESAFAHHKIAPKVRGASIQPGRPIFVGRGGGGQTVVGLPGNPVSALACACLFVWPIVRQLLGLDAQLPWREVELADAVKPNPQRWAFRPCRLIDHGHAVVPTWAGSGDLVHTARTDGLLALPRQAALVPARTRLQFLPWP
jgi:molybdopterin molybdotransferase